MATTMHVVDVDDASFEAEVVERSHDVPVVVDFWAAWCGPCRTLGPALEAAVAARDGAVVLAKVDIDANRALAQRFRIQGIPAVKAFRDGRVVSEFVGAIGPPQIDAFLDAVVPSAADRAVRKSRELATTDPAAAERELRAALEAQPRHCDAAVALAQLLVDDDPKAALELAAPHRPDPAAEAVVTRAELAMDGHGDEAALRDQVARDPGDGDARVALARVLAARREYAAAVDHLLAAVAAGGDAREPAREQLVALFNLLGDDDAVVKQGRPRLARALF